MVVLPVPRGPQNRYAWDRRPSVMACSSVETICCWPTTESKVSGRYFRYNDSMGAPPGILSLVAAAAMRSHGILHSIITRTASPPR